MAEGTVAVLQCKVPNPTHRVIENWKMYAIKQIKICAESKDMVPNASVGLSGSWQTRLGLGYHVLVFCTDLNLYNSGWVLMI